ncbi:MAG: PAS domain-containing protein, partial [Candidatus Aegiribacteria sp.]|nr:PAS domain-containing protein [Candidatus Aegiribacteria sp.]
MILFPGISPKVMWRVLFPFIFSTIAIVAVIAAYIHFTNDMYSQIIRMEQEQATQTAKSIICISMDDNMSSIMFNCHQSNGFTYLDLKQEFLGYFNLSEFIIVYAIYGDAFTGFPFEEDSLAESAISSGSPAMQYVERGKENSLLVFYPVVDSSRNTSVARMVFENVYGNEILSRRYNFYIILSAAVILLIVTCLFLKLADLRRQIEKNGFYQSDAVVNTNVNVEIMTLDECSSSFLDGFEFPALFRLDGNGAVLYMNNSAEKLIDISKNDINGAKFHEIPCFAREDQDLIEYPEHEEPSELILGIIDSSGSSRKAVFRIEMLGETGYVISVKDIENKLPGTGESEINSQVPEVSAGGLSDSDIQRIRSYLEEGKK